MLRCYHCQTELKAESDFGRQERCPKCGFPTRCCKNCIHYEPSKYNECLEPVADRVVDKEKGNFCDYFKPGNNGSGGDKDRKAAARAAAEALFKK